MTPEQKTQRQQLKDEYDRAWEHAQRQYYILCAKNSIRLASLPEFRSALTTLEFYDRYPSSASRAKLSQVYRDLRRGWGTANRDYGYTPVGTFYRALVHILYQTLHPRNCSTGDVFGFVEAHGRAASAIKTKMWGPLMAERAADEAQKKLWEQVWTEFHEKYGNSRHAFVEREIKKRLKAA